MRLLFLIVFICTLVLAENPDYPNKIPTNIQVKLGSTIKGRISSNDDLDAIKFIVPANTHVLISIKSNFNSIGYIYNDNSTYNNQYIYDVRGYTPYSQPYFLKQKTTFYVKIQGYQYAVGNYTVTYQLNPDINTRNFTKLLINNTDNLNIYGNDLVIGNQLVCQNDEDGAKCEQPKIGATNNDIFQHKVRIDTSNNAPQNNSMARLDLKLGDKIIWAGLYWSARIYSSSTDHPYAPVIYMRTPHAKSYTKYTSVPNKYNWYDDGYVFDYGCMADVTSAVKNAGGGEYYVGGIDSSDGTNTFAGWSLIVIVQNSNRKFRNISVYDGFKVVYNGGSYPHSVSIVANNFLTPRSGNVDASLITFTGESEAGLNNTATITNKNNVPSSLVTASNNPNDVFNGSISTYGIYRSTYRTSDPTLANPNFQNVIGMDIHQMKVNNLSNLQTSTTITIASKGDRYSLNMFALATQLYVPKFCYDYAYSQNGVYFTQKNDGTKDPRLVGSVVSQQPIVMKIFLKNLINSDINITDLNLSVMDLNTTQVKYISGTTKLTPPNSLFAQTLTSPPLIESPSFVKNILVGTVPAQGYFYLYYNLNPQKSDLNTSINVIANYNLHIGSSTIPYSSALGSKIKMCSNGDFNYTPAKGIFDIVDNSYYSTVNASPRYYNIPTQVTSRDGNFKVISLDPKNLDTLKPASTVIAVDMINAQAFHDVNASCDEPDSAISPRVWMIVDNTDNIPFTKTALQNAINNNMTTLQNSYDFYKQARRNAAFRVSYNTDSNGTLIGVTKLGTNSYKLTNFPAYGGQQCSPTYTGTQTTVSSVCGSNGSGSGQSGMTQAQLAQCMECIYGKATRFVCSRDNFAIRPEAFLIDINDQNQTNSINKISIARGTNPPPILNLAAGYNYNLHVIATNHQNNNASPSFYTTLNNILDNNASYAWKPANHLVAGCNDVTNHDINVSFSNGIADMNTSISQVGQYKLSLLDSTWTDVDHNPAYMAHHTGQYFKTGADCIKNSSITQSINANAINGCDVSSDENNTDANIKYYNINVLFHPYKFDLTTVIPSIGLNHNTSDFGTKNSFVYMSDLAVLNDENMSFHLNGQVRAEGKNNAILSNFVTKCYAEPIDLNISKTGVKTPPAFMYMFHDLNASGKTISSTSGDLNNTKIPIVLNDGNFTKELKGAMQTILNLNFNRDQTKPQNPQKITFHNYTAQCQIPSNCSFKADLKDKNTTGLLNLNKTVTFYYGRTHAPNYKFKGSSGSGFIYYEVYDNNASTKVLLPNGINTKVSVDGINWYNNAYHIATKDGTLGLVTEKTIPPHVTLNSINTTKSPTPFTLNYDGTQDYPYQTTMQNNPSGWLIYNPYNNAIKTNQFSVRFYKSTNKWTGVQDTNTSTNSNASIITNQRVLW